MAPLYAAFSANNSGHLRVSSVHSLYYEECGKADGVPILYLHGARWWDHRRRQTLLRPIPLQENPLRPAWLWEVHPVGLARGEHHLGPRGRHREAARAPPNRQVDRLWRLMGSTLALAYAQAHPPRCLGLILRGIFTLQRSELEWFYQAGANMLFPEYFEAYEAVIPEAERGDIMAAYYKRLTGDDEDKRLKCATAWSTWETATSKLIIDPEYIAKVDDPKWALAFARIESHFFVNGGWMEDGQLIKNAHKIKHLPISITQGRYDVVCPAKTSWDLYQALGGKSNTNVDYNIVPDSGHSAHEKAIEEALVDAANKFKSLKS